MKLLPRHGLARRLGALGLFLLSVTVHAQSFQPIVQGRWVLIGGDASIVGQDGRVGSGTDFLYQPVQPDTNFSPFNHTETLLLDVASPDATAAAHLRGSASQTSSIGPEAIRFEGSVTASSTTSGTPGPGSRVNPGGESFFGLLFDVAAPTSVVLSLQADLAGFGVMNFNFLDNTDGTRVFSERATSAENGTGGVAPHQLTFVLAPGSYDLSLRLDSSVASLNGSATATAAFSVIASAIPEPQSWLMLLAGLPLMGAAARIKRRCGSRPKASY